MPTIQQSLSVLNQAISLRTQRHQVLASNIANADTPNYKARDFDFAATMSQALSGQASSGALPLATTASGHLAGGSGNGAIALKYRAEGQSAVDGNTVDMDAERSQIADNALQYQILTQLISDRFKGLRTALGSTTG